MASAERYPAAFINHGGGPLPLLGGQPEVVESLKKLRNRIEKDHGKPKAILVISAHYETDVTTILTAPSPSMYFDYYGFPAVTYTYEYAGKTSAEMNERVREVFRERKIKFKEDNKRGLDHGLFIPLMIMYPECNIPVIVVSQPQSLDPKECLALGNALSAIRDLGVFVLGSGSSFHNVHALSRSHPSDMLNANLFNEWLKESMVVNNKMERWNLVQNWKELAPHGVFAHPREEHLTPLFVVVGAADNDQGIALDSKYFSRHSGQSFSMSQYIFGL